MGDARTRRRSREGGLARLRCRRGARGRSRRAGANQRQGARPTDGAGRNQRGPSAGSRAGGHRGQNPHGRENHPQGGRGERAARVGGGAMNRDRRVWARGLVVLAAALSVPGCGYSLAGRGSFLPAYVKTIGVPMFTNRTTVFNLETLLTEKVRSEFIG